MPMIQCDIRRGRTEEQKRTLAKEIIRVVNEVTGIPKDYVFIVIRELPGFNFVEFQEHVVDYVPGPDGQDIAGQQQLKELGAE
ncbi:MAG: tautomerase family protein [Proteobacteria bacterium]|nr:tautomerase family protein [Pseudomonadota bacterium]